MLDRREELKEDGMPADAELHGQADTPHKRKSGARNEAAPTRRIEKEFMKYGYEIISFSFKPAEWLQGQTQGP